MPRRREPLRSRRRRARPAHAVASEVWHETRARVWYRAKGRCERCGQSLPGGPYSDRWQCHHRKLRSQGGHDTLDNLLALHDRCHAAGLGGVHATPEDSYSHGWMVRSTDDPATARVLIAGWRSTRTWALLTSDGRYVEADAA